MTSPTAQNPAAAADLDVFLKQNEESELLRLSTAGSVDDGKSTLIGRLLFDSKGVYEDQISSIRKASVNRNAGPIDFSLLTDGLRAEREQGITIDVAYRYFSTPKRKFIIADTPGHEQYTRNMATGASTANVAIILVDARNGVLQQSRRHAFIASLLGIPHIVVAINKMDLVGFSQEVYESIRATFGAFAAQLQVQDIHYIPISALLGDNVVDKSENMPWFEGDSLLHHLENVHIASDVNRADFRFPVQLVLRPHQDFRGFAGQISSGVVRQGDPVMVLPSGRTSRISRIVTYDGDLESAFAPMSVTLCLEDEVDISRGDMLVHPDNTPHISRRIEANVVWMNQSPLDPEQSYLIKHSTHLSRATIHRIQHRVDVNTLEKMPASRLQLNEIGVVSIETHRPLIFDSYRRSRFTGSFILIHPITNETVGAGMITGVEFAVRKEAVKGAETAETARVTPAERMVRYGHTGGALWLTDALDVAYRVERMLFERGCLVCLLDNSANDLKLPELASALAQAGVLAICAASPADSEEVEIARQQTGADRFVDRHGDSLPREIDAAAAAVVQMLEQKGLLKA